MTNNITQAAANKAAEEGDLPRLDNEEIDIIWQSMPGGPANWLKGFGYQAFAKAIEDEVLLNVQRAADRAVMARRAPQSTAAPTVPAIDFDEWFNVHSDGVQLRSDKSLEELRGLFAHQPAQEQAEPVAYAIYGINGRGKHYLSEVKPIQSTDTTEEWKWDDGCLGEYWAGNEPLGLIAAAPQAPVAAAPKDSSN